jgi:hypothetical protein
MLRLVLSNNNVFTRALTVIKRSEKPPVGAPPEAPPEVKEEKRLGGKD